MDAAAVVKRLLFAALLLLAAFPAFAAADCSHYAAARDLLAPFADCFGNDPQGPLAAATLSDLAIAAFHAGDGEGCAEALAPYGPDDKGSPQRLEALPAGLRQVVLFNLRLCTSGCPMVAPTCQSIAAALALQKPGKGNFTARACPFPVGDDAVGLLQDRNACLTVLPSRAGIPWGERAAADPKAVCPRLALARKAAGAVRTTEIALPQDSWLGDLEICCVKPVIGVAPDGSFAIEPEDNPPEGCLTGHRTFVVEEIYTLDRDRLRLKHKLREGCIDAGNCDM
jgi:hypothetical protein